MLNQAPSPCWLSPRGGADGCWGLRSGCGAPAACPREHPGVSAPLPAVLRSHLPLLAFPCLPAPFSLLSGAASGSCPDVPLCSAALPARWAAWADAATLRCQELGHGSAALWLFGRAQSRAWVQRAVSRDLARSARHGTIPARAAW